MNYHFRRVEIVYDGLPGSPVSVTVLDGNLLFYVHGAFAIN
jgi:hypothetical protein